ncbi:MAG: UTP--glucose-1-phosphate uridylyltransferase, partial [bacterium]|nr:UTP--glucose-1-phosphate uridylyltransferase [bacterium]
GLVEKPLPEEAPSRCAVIGRYVLQPEVFEVLSSQKTGSGGEIQLTDALSSLIPDIPFSGFKFEGTRYDCGSKVGMLAAGVAVGIRHGELGDRAEEEVRNVLNTISRVRKAV